MWAADDGLAETFDDYVNFAIIRAHSTGPFEAQVAKDSKVVQKSSVEQQISCQDLQQGYSLFYRTINASDGKKCLGPDRKMKL